MDSTSPGRPGTPAAAARGRFEVVGRDGTVALARLVGPADGSLVPAAFDLVERLTAEDRAVAAIRVEGGLPPAALAELGAHAAALPVAGRPGAAEIAPALAWQMAGPWLPGGAAEPFPLRRSATAGRGHPLRRTKPEGTVYRRRIPWLDATLSFRAAVPGDAALLFRWMNDPRVAAIWDEAGPEHKQRAYVEGLRADPHVLPLIGEIDGRPFGWFEVYHAAESRLGALYRAEDWDRGWHVAIGEEGCRGRAHVSAWLPSLMHYMFLDEPRTQRIVGEPRADHAQQLRNLHRSGFSTVATVEFPHKRAALVMLGRERFFGDGLWAPDGPVGGPVRGEARA